MTEKSFFAGFGGQGVISMGQIWVYCAMKEGKNVTFFPFYGAEKRGGIARASVIISDEEIASPLVTSPDSALVMNSDSLPLCEKALKQGGVMLINSSLVKERPVREDITVATVEATGIAEKLAERAGGAGGKAANMVALGAMAKLTSALRLTGIEAVLRDFFPPDKHKFVAMNVEAIQAGFNAV
ncbi:MAG: 2-oxoacid:acceptor oxidoreductase family protein [Treponema sp.]|jgi:2-oxoglutarate ferredoxin oxidoreductase subunit gamma|nr:2-oxoacid:acceptor oxidoreductase family protein [Treponema sp.]